MEYSVDVIIPVYNSERYILETINSVLRQTVLPSKLIVIDDGSTDKTAEMVKLVENSSRDVQIAFANQVDAMCKTAGINTFEVIECDISVEVNRIYAYRPDFIRIECEVCVFGVDNIAEAIVGRACNKDTCTDTLGRSYIYITCGPAYDGI